MKLKKPGQNELQTLNLEKYKHAVGYDAFVGRFLAREN